MSQTMSGIQSRMAGAQGGGFNPDGTRHTTYQDPNLTPQYQRFLQHYGKAQPAPASQDPYYTRNPAYEQPAQGEKFQGGGWGPGQWRGPGQMPERIAGLTARPIPESIFQRPYDTRPAPMAPPQGYGPGQTPGSGKLNQRRVQGQSSGVTAGGGRTIGRTPYNRIRRR